MRLIQDLPQTIPDAVGAEAYRDAMARLAAAVNIVTTDGPHGRAGFAASAVCSVSDAPATLLVCIQRKSSAFAAVMGNGVLCVNTLAAGHEALSRRFGGKTPMAERFDAASWHSLATGAPVLAGAAAAFDCRIQHAVDAGTHQVLFCTVLALGAGAQPLSCLVYAGRGYHGLSLSSAPQHRPE
ncbi:flavin reductase [Xylophilus sp. GW821-FHT01B05]